MALKALNNAYSTLAAGINSSVTTIPVQTGHGARFAIGSDHGYVTIENTAGDIEICKLTGQTGDSLTVVRAQDGTTARSWVSGDVIECRPCAAEIADLQAEFTAAVAAHVNDTTDAHDASAISYAGATGLSATDVEAALDELDAEKEPADANIAKVNAAETWTQKQIFQNTIKAQQALEKITVTAAAPSETQHFDWLSQAVRYFTTNAANNWTLNVRGDGANTLDSQMAIGEKTTLTVMATMGATPYYASSLTIDGAAVTPRWRNGAAPAVGIPNAINTYTYTIIKTGSGAFAVLASFAAEGKTLSPRPLVARASGVAVGSKALAADTPTKVIWGAVDFDTEPNRVVGTTSGLIVITGGGSDAPNGNILLRRAGYYRIKAQVYYEPPSSGTEVSGYITIVDGGTSGSGTTNIAVANDEIPQGEHPSLSLDRIVKSETPGNYFHIKTYYLRTIPPDPVTLDLQTDSIYSWLEIEYLGEL